MGCVPEVPKYWDSTGSRTSNTILKLWILDSQTVKPDLSMVLGKLKYFTDLK